MSAASFSLSHYFNVADQEQKVNGVDTATTLRSHAVEV